MFQNPLGTNNPQGYSTNNSPPDKKMMLLGGGGIVLILVIVGMLLFSGGGGNKNSKAWQDLVNNEKQIVVISEKYNKDLTDPNLQNAAATTILAWQTNNQDIEKIYGEIFGKKAQRASSTIYKPLATNLDSAKTAGNLDSVFAATILKQLNLVKSNIKAIEGASPGPKTNTQLQKTNKLVEYTLKLLQPFTS